MLLFIDRKKLTNVLLILVIVLIGLIGINQLINHNAYQPTLSWVVADKKVVIDPGHGGMFPGKVSSTGVLEKDINLAISQRLHDMLQESGSIAMMTRTEDVDLVDPNVHGKNILKLRSDLQRRVDLTKESNGEIFISIHCNSAPSKKWTGAQVFYTPGSEESAKLATSIQASLGKIVDTDGRQALPRKDTFLFEHLSIPAVIVECGFLSNDKETIKLQDPDYQEQVAYAVYRGLADYLTIDVIEH